MKFKNSFRINDLLNFNVEYSEFFFIFCLIIEFYVYMYVLK